MFGRKCTFRLILIWNLVQITENKNVKLSQRRGRRILKQYYVNLKNYQFKPVNQSFNGILFRVYTMQKSCYKFGILLMDGVSTIWLLCKSYVLHAKLSNAHFSRKVRVLWKWTVFTVRLTFSHFWQCLNFNVFHYELKIGFQENF